MGDLLQPWHIIVLAIVAFLLFGAKRLPELGKGLGEGLKGFREGTEGRYRPATTAANSAAEHRPATAFERTGRAEVTLHAQRFQPQVRRALFAIRCAEEI